MTIVLVPNLSAYKDTTLACARHSSSLSFVPQDMSLNIDIKRILPVKDSGVCPIELRRSLILSQSCNVVNPGKMFHSNSVDSPLIVLPSFVAFRMLKNFAETQHRI